MGKVAIRGRHGGYPEMIEYFRKKSVNVFGIKGSLEDEYYFINSIGNLVSRSNPEGYTLYKSVEDVVKKRKSYELWEY